MDPLYSIAQTNQYKNEARQPGVREGGNHTEGEEQAFLTWVV
jgi:hypothetical protein